MRRFIGIPFRDGKNCYQGANCYGLAQLFYRDIMEIDIPDLHTHSDHSNRVWATYLKEISEHWDNVESPEFGDIVAMAQNVAHPRIVQHVGIYIGEGKVLHTLSNIGSHIVTLESVKHSVRGYHRWRR